MLLFLSVDDSYTYLYCYFFPVFQTLCSLLTASWTVSEDVHGSGRGLGDTRQSV